MRRFGERPKPRLLVYGSPELPALVSDFFPTIRLVEELDSVDEDEFDVFVSKGRTGIGSRSFTLALGGKGSVPHLPRDKNLPNFAALPASSQPVIGFGDVEFTVSRVFLVPNDLPHELQEIIQERLIPLLQRRSANPVLQWRTHFAMPRPFLEMLPPVESLVHPFVTTERNEILAGRYDRLGGTTECWCLPVASSPEVAEWLKVAMGIWRTRSSDQFPTREEWRTSATWTTPAEDAIRKELTALDDEQRRVTTVLQEKRDALTLRSSAAANEAEAGPRRLLLEKGDALTDAVRECLSDLGFDVTKMDDVQPAGDKVEDLRLQDPDDETWIALAEVKGYKAGAKSNDLLLFAKFIGRFGGEPGACWYIVNQFAGDDPSKRPPALAAKEAELATFAEASSGLVIDTADLYRVWKAVTAGHLAAVDARTMLRQSRGRFVYKASGSPRESSG